MLARGQILSGKYRLEQEIGRGGMGSVWRSTRLDLGTSLALKVMHGLASDNPSGFDRLSREARAAASLSSPHVVRVIDFGVDTTENATFIAMELLEGESLAQRLERGRLSIREVARVITPLARALSQAHAAGIIHRDLKPANIFLVQNGDDDLVKLLDFGVAKAIGALGGGLATATGHVLGTPFYMSPEQVNSLRDIDHRTDIWSLGVIASECLTGRRPFRADTLSELAMKISLGRAEVPSSVTAVPAGFDRWFSHATAVEPARRFQSVTELATELRALAAAAPAESTPASTRFALASTQRSESPGAGLPPPPTQRLETQTASDRWGASQPALSTTAHGGALSTNQRATGSRGAKGRALWVGGAALLGVGVLGAALSGVFRGSVEPPRPTALASTELGSTTAGSTTMGAGPLGSAATVTEPLVPTPAGVPAVAVAADPVTADAVPADAIAAGHASAASSGEPSTPSLPASKATAKKVRPASSKAAKPMSKRLQERLDAYDIP